MFENLSDRIQGIFKNLRGEGKLSAEHIESALKEIRMALLEADVNFKVVREFVKRATEKAVGADVLQAVRPGEQFVKIVHDELVETMGGQSAEFKLEPDRRNVILLLGLQGSGKTTFSGKLAKALSKKKFRPLLVACDIYRPAAIRQLQVVGEQVDTPVFTIDGSQDVPKIAAQALKQAQQDDRNLVIVDTAGRLHIDEVKIDELKALKAKIKPNYTFLVADAMTGQDAVNSAALFDEKVGIDGVCLTKLDGDARGGAALSIRQVTGKPIVYCGIGEKLDDLEFFHPDRMASRILGMGDVLTLVEKAQETFDEKQAEKALQMQKKLKKGELSFQDFLDQMEAVKKMGPLQSIMKMIPGMGNALKDVDLDESEIGRVRGIIHSMTLKEREMPQLLNGSRRKRIADGAGVTVAQVNDLVKQFEQSKKMMKQMMQGGGMGLPGMGGGGGQKPVAHGGGKGSGGGAGGAAPDVFRKRAKKKKKPKKKRR